MNPRHLSPGQSSLCFTVLLKSAGCRPEGPTPPGMQMDERVPSSLKKEKKGEESQKLTSGAHLGERKGTVRVIMKIQMEPKCGDPVGSLQGRAGTQNLKLLGTPKAVCLPMPHPLISLCQSLWSLWSLSLCACQALSLSLRPYRFLLSASPPLHQCFLCFHVYQWG